MYNMYHPTRFPEEKKLNTVRLRDVIAKSQPNLIQIMKQQFRMLFRPKLFSS